MYIKDLQPRQGNVELEAEVKEIGDVREFDKFGKKGRVANAILSDGTGTVKLSLWNEQIDTINAGDKVKVSKGYVSEWQGELQLTTGKFGTLEVVSGESDSDFAPGVDPVSNDAESIESEVKPESSEGTIPPKELDVEEESI